MLGGGIGAVAKVAAPLLNKVGAKVVPILKAGIARAGQAVGGFEAVTGRVATRINLANGATRFTPLRSTGNPVSAGWKHVLEGHFNRTVGNNRSVFSISPEELRTLLQNPQVVQAPVRALGDGQFLRIVDVGRAIGTSSLNNGGRATSVLSVFTDTAGNLITAYPR